MPRALPLPATAMTSNTSIMPVTVPSRPNIGHSATMVLDERQSALCSLSSTSSRRADERIWWAFQEEWSLRAFHFRFTRATALASFVSTRPEVPEALDDQRPHQRR